MNNKQKNNNKKVIYKYNNLKCEFWKEMNYFIFPNRTRKTEEGKFACVCNKLFSYNKHS